jgi:DNA-binding MarR family transcriptional regulator
MAAPSARFTPSLLDAETLERLFVNREPLVADITARIIRAAHSSERSHKLVIGPRGAGKTHLISLAYHRSRQSPDFGISFQVAWLPEDPWTIESYEDLLQAILDRCEPASDMRGARAEDKLLEVVRSHGPIVVLAENLDQIFEAIGADDQRRLRGLLENERPLLFIATATRITDYLIDQAYPFYGFFDTTNLQPFDLSEAIAMLKAIAALNNDQPLLHRLDEQRSHARLSAVEHLAGGQPRVWAMLGAGLTIERLDELVSTLLERFDDLTPYYQEQLARLSPRERKTVKALADINRAATVRDLAGLTNSDERSLAKTLTDLRRRGWVTVRKGLLTDRVDKRLSFYQLAEPLIRIAFQLKASRGEPIKLVVDFLTAWFDQDELAGAYTTPAAASYAAAAIDHASQLPQLLTRVLSDSMVNGSGYFTDRTAARYAARRPPDIAKLQRTLESLDDALAAFDAGNGQPLLEQPPELCDYIEHRLETSTSRRLRFELVNLALNLPDVSPWIARINDALVGANDIERTLGWLCASLLHLRAGNGTASGHLLRKAMLALTQRNDIESATVAIATAEGLLRQANPGLAIDVLEAVRPIVDARQELRTTSALNAAYLRTGRAADVLPLWERAAERTLCLLGPHDPDTLAVRSNLADWRGEAGDRAGAAAAYEQLLTDMLRVLGPDHFDTLSTRGNLARWRGRAGDRAGAVVAFEELLPEMLRVLGPDHLDTLTTLANLAHWRGEAGEPAGAVVAFEELLPEMLRVLGPDHPDTLSTRGNLAHWRGRAGEPAGAVAAFEELLPEMLRVLGRDHPDTLITRGNLAHWRGEAGEPAGAVAAFEELLPEMLRVLGRDHPDTLTIRSNLADWRGRAGDLAGSVVAFEELLPEMLRVLGPDHPVVLITCGNLAQWRGEVGDLAGAVVAFEELLPEMLRVLGRDHPQTLITRSNLADWTGRAGEPTRAVAAFEELLPEMLRVLGRDHPDTLSTRGNLARWRGEAGDLAGAVVAFEELLPEMLRVLGRDHPDTLTTRRYLADWRGRAGDLAGAVVAFEELLPETLRVLGPDHPQTLITRGNLAVAYRAAGQLTGALPLLEAAFSDMLRILGPDHPYTLTIRGNLASAHQEAQD